MAGLPETHSSQKGPLGSQDRNKPERERERERERECVCVCVRVRERESERERQREGCTPWRGREGKSLLDRKS